MSRLVRWRRTARVWRLTARNGGRYVVHRLRRFGNRGTQRDELDQQFAIRTSEDVARELGNMKGALMKFGQLLSFIMEALPDDAQKALATLQSDATPMAPALAAKMVTDELGATARARSSSTGRSCPSPRRASARCTAPSPATDARSP